MSRVARSPVVATVLVLLWLILVGEWSLAHVLLAVAIAAVVPLYSDRLRAHRAHMRSPLFAAKLAAVVVYDIVKSNIEVAILILGPESRIRPSFIWIPLEIESTHGIAALAGIITMTPGTLSCDLTPDHRHLLVHCLNLDDADATIAQIKQRYEAPLMKIFPT